MDKDRGNQGVCSTVDYIWKEMKLLNIDAFWLVGEKWQLESFCVLMA